MINIVDQCASNTRNLFYEIAETFEREMPDSPQAVKFILKAMTAIALQEELNTYFSMLRQYLLSSICTASRLSEGLSGDSEIVKCVSVENYKLTESVNLDQIPNLDTMLQSLTQKDFMKINLTMDLICGALISKQHGSTDKLLHEAV